MSNRDIARWVVTLAALFCLTASSGKAVQVVDPVKRAKDVAKQGEEQLAEVRKAVGAENYGEALRVLTEYRNAVKSAHDALKATGRNAEKKPNGFKNLQMHLRHGLQQLDQTLLTVPSEERAPFDALRKELDSIDRELIDALFPRQPPKKGGSKPGP